MVHGAAEGHLDGLADAGRASFHHLDLVDGLVQAQGHHLGSRKPLPAGETVGSDERGRSAASQQVLGSDEPSLETLFPHSLEARVCFTHSNPSTAPFIFTPCLFRNLTHVVGGDVIITFTPAATLQDKLQSFAFLMGSKVTHQLRLLSKKSTR